MFGLNLCRSIVSTTAFHFVVVEFVARIFSSRRHSFSFAGSSDGVRTVPLSLQRIESRSKGLENCDHCGRSLRPTFNEKIFGFELGAFCIENLRERSYPPVETDCG